jgi:predicted aspartyl protease
MPEGVLIMESATMGRVLTEATIENLKDLWDAERGMMPADQVRRVHVTDAMVDTGATTLALPTRLIRQLGLSKSYEKPGRSSKGIGSVSVFDVVHLTLLGRTCAVEVMEVPDEIPVLIGQIPLEMLDLVVNPRECRLTGNPAHGGEHILEI